MAVIPSKNSPRISVNDLALFMVASDTGRVGIVKRAKYPSKPPMIRYADVRPALCAYLSDPMRNVNPLLLAQEMFEQRLADPAVKPLKKEDAELSLQVLKDIQSMSNKLKGLTFLPSPKEQPKLDVSGVIVSVRADLLVEGVHKGNEQRGAAVFRMTVDDADSDAAKSKRKEMGQYVATVVRMHADQNIKSNHKLANRLCMSIDVQHKDVFLAPESITNRIKNIQSACQMIAALWPTL